MGEVIKASFTQTDKYLSACGRRARKPARTAMDVFCQIEAETGGQLDNDEFTRRIEERCKALGIKS